MGNCYIFVSIKDNGIGGMQCILKGNCARDLDAHKCSGQTLMRRTFDSKAENSQPAAVTAGWGHGEISCDTSSDERLRPGFDLGSSYGFRR